MCSCILLLSEYDLPQTLYILPVYHHILLCFVSKCGKDRLSINVCFAVNYQQTLEETERTIQ